MKYQIRAASIEDYDTLEALKKVCDDLGFPFYNRDHTLASIREWPYLVMEASCTAGRASCTEGLEGISAQDFISKFGQSGLLCPGGRATLALLKECVKLTEDGVITNLTELRAALFGEQDL